MSDEEKKDILFQIDMQLYDEFNDKFCEINDNLGTVYSYKDLDDLEKAEKETEIRLLRQAIEKQSKEIEELKEENKEIREWKYVIDNPIDLKKLSELDIIKIFGKSYIAKDKIKAKIEEIDKVLNKDIYVIDGHYDDRYYRYLQDKKVLQSLLEKE